MFAASDGLVELSWDDLIISCEGVQQECSHDFVYVEDNNLIFRTDHNVVPTSAHGATLPVEFGENFDLEFRMKIEEFSEQWGMYIVMMGERIALAFEEYALLYQRANDPEFSSTFVDIGHDWHTWRIECRDEGMATIYMDDMKVLEYEYTISTNAILNYNQISIYGGPRNVTSPKFEIDYFALKNLDNCMALTPAAGSIYNAGDNVVIAATPAGNPGSVDYYINNVKVGSGTSANGYQYTLYNVQPGVYSLTAKASGETDSFKRNFYVKDTRTASLSVPDEVTYGNAASVSLSASDSVGISSVDYFLNGRLVGNTSTSPYGYGFSNLELGTSTIYADVYYADGTMVRSEIENMNVKASGLQSGRAISLGQEYDLSYTAASGASLNLYDGKFALIVSHTENSLSYTTNSGTKQVSTVPGKFRIVVTSGIAEVYRDGQFLVSFCMATGLNADSIQYSGISDVSLGGSGVKTTVYSRIIDGETEVLDENINVGLYYSLEFDKLDTSAETIHLYDGEYEILLEIDGGIKTRIQETTKGAVEERTIANSVKTGYYRLTVQRGLAQLFVDNNFVASFRAPFNPHNRMFSRTMSSADKSTFVAIKNTDDVYYFEDDFAGDNELDWSEYWYCATDIPASTTDTIVTGSVENGALKLTGSGTYVLDAIAENPTLKWKMSLPAKEGWGKLTGQIAIALRYRDDYNNVKIVYNYTDPFLGTDTGSWSLVETVGGVATTTSLKSGFMKLGESHEFELTVVDDLLSLKYDNTEICSNKQLSFKGNGKLGFSLINQSSITIDDVSYVGNGKVNSGVEYAAWATAEMGHTAEFYQDTAGNVHSAAITTAKDEDGVERTVAYDYLTTDSGSTWTKTETSKAGVMLKLNSGKLLTAGYGGGDHITLRIFDSPEATEYSKQVLLSGIGDALHGRLIQTTTGKIFICGGKGSEIWGNIKIYYSTDDGQNWTATETVINTDVLDGLIVAEPQIVELPNGNIRLFLRTDGGFIYYTDSTDGGKTFSLDVKPTQLTSPTTCFAVTRDYTASTPTYYAIFEYDITTADPSMQQGPRNRFAIARSYDCEQWEYIMEMEDRGTESALYHVNPNIRAFDGVVYASGGNYEAINYAKGRDILCLTFVLDTTKIRTRERFANAHYVRPKYETAHDFALGQAVLPKASGVAMISGQMVPARVDNGNMYDINTISRIFGLTASRTSDGVTFQMGNGSVVLKSGSSSYTINGNSAEASTVCLSEDGNYVSIQACAEIFGVNLIDNGDSYLLLNPKLTEGSIDELEALVSGTSGALNICIGEFKQISNVSELKAFFEKYSDLLYITDTFSDEAYSNMFTAFSLIDKENIREYSDLAEDIDLLVDAEKAKIKQFLNELNTAAAAGDSKEIETLLTVTYADIIPFEIDTSEFQNPGAIYKKMTGITYYSIDEVENVFYAVFEAQRYAEEGRDNAIIMSSVSKYFDGWNVIRSNNFGGVSISQQDENIATLSAYEGLKSAGKDSVETGLEGYVYQAPGSFGSNIESAAATVDSANGTVTFNNQDGNFTVKDASGSRAKSNSIITVFDITKPKGMVTGTFCDGYHSVKFDFTEKGTDIAPLPESLRNAEKLTYRIEKSLGAADIMVKAANAPDTDYVVLGNKTKSDAPKSYWFVKFEGNAATAEISNIGVYAATPNVKYDISGYTLRDDYSFSANGTSGYSMQDLINVSPAITTGSPVVDADGNLELAQGSDLSFGGYSDNLTSFDRAELDITVSVPTGDNMFIYWADNSGNRYQSYYWGLGETNGVSSQYEKSWETGKFYSLKFITQVAEHDETGRPRTSASLYVKDTATGKWVCLARNIVLEWRQSVTLPQIMLYLQTNDSTHKMVVSDFALKTYTKSAGEYSYINNAVDMPSIDYNFSFDYMRINGNDATEFVIGGTDYHQTFQIESVEEDIWYRFYGTVKNTQNTAQKRITLYRADIEGNIVTIAENLPMLKSAGNNGIKFRLSDTTSGGVKLKNIRVYNGKALDVISAKANNGSATVIADFLNDGVAMSEDATILTGIYNNDVLSGAGMDTLTGDLPAYGTKPVTITNVKYNNELTEPKIKIFTWKDLINLVPLSSPVEVQ